MPVIWFLFLLVTKNQVNKNACDGIKWFSRLRVWNKIDATNIRLKRLQNRERKWARKKKRKKETQLQFPNWKICVIHWIMEFSSLYYECCVLSLLFLFNFYESSCSCWLDVHLLYFTKYATQMPFTFHASLNSKFLFFLLCICLSFSFHSFRIFISWIRKMVLSCIQSPVTCVRFISFYQFPFGFSVGVCVCAFHWYKVQYQ